jgi:hypothetical protein
MESRDDSKISDREITLVKRVAVKKKGQSEFQVLEKGRGLVRFAHPSEVVPDRMEYYNKCDMGGNKFVLTSFSPLVEWETIKALCKYGHIVVKIGFKK